MAPLTARIHRTGRNGRRLTITARRHVTLLGVESPNADNFLMTDQIEPYIGYEMEPGESITSPVSASLATPNPVELVVRWDEGGEEGSRKQLISL